MGALPSTAKGGVVVRLIDGTPTDPPHVLAVHVPGEDFDMSCPMTALPSTCDARFDPAQINGIVSELVALAEAFNPAGTWSCSAVDNVATNFTAWVEGTGAGTLSEAVLDTFGDPPWGI